MHAVCTSTPQGPVSGTFNACDNPTSVGQTCTGSCIAGYTGSLNATCTRPDTWTTTASVVHALLSVSPASALTPGIIAFPEGSQPLPVCLTFSIVQQCTSRLMSSGLTGLQQLQAGSDNSTVQISKKQPAGSPGSPTISK